MYRMILAGMAALSLGIAASTAQAVITTADPNLPPMDPYRYLAPSDVHAEYAGAALRIVLQRPEHLAIICRDPAGSAGGPNRTDDGVNEFEEFCSEMRNATVGVDAGNNGSIDQTFTGVGAIDPVRSTRTVVFGKVGNVTGTFQTEMLAMQMFGTTPVPFIIRESPTLPSRGQTTITAVGGGLYQIDSFFDVFTELSLDGGATWMPSNGPTHVTLVPEPSSFVLAGLGLAGFIGYKVRRRRSV